MKIVFVTTMSGAPWGGSEELWSQAALRLAEKHHRIAASVVPWPTLSPKVAELKDHGIEVFVRWSPALDLTARVWRKIARSRPKDYEWMRKISPDLVVISQGGNSDGVEWMKFCSDEGLPFVAVLQCNGEWLWPGDELAGEMAAAYSAARKVFCVSRKNLELLERQTGVNLSNAVIVRNPFNVSPDPPPPWPEGIDIWKLACVARLEPAAKGQDLLFQVMALPQWRDRPVQVNLFGAGACERSLRQLAERFQLNTVHFRDQVTDVKSIWAANHLLILPSRYEGLSLALVEAMWCRRPALITDVGDNADLCLDGETGFVASAPTVTLLEQTLERAWNCRREWQAMGKAARARVEQLIPRDPIGDFCEQLMECASA
ncbi:MAG TPA: glycosyltransferase family 4 protein [Pyrinomonadaceae bacterium]|nr:glycosyltransferase family 4 protein [Pyrinomonadaceae bacterium]